MNRNHVWLAIAIAAGVAGLIAWEYTQKPQKPAIEQLGGTVTYRERVALPPGASAEISLVDISLADAPASVVSSQTINDPGQVPISFSIDYDPALLDERSRYAAQARITIDGQLAFINDTVYPVITHGAGTEVHLVLRQVQRKTSFPVDKIRAAQNIDSRREELMQMDGTLLTGQASITYRAWRDDKPDGDIILIEEKREMGIYGNAVVTIYYSGGKPFRYTEAGRRRSESGMGIDSLDKVAVSFEYDEEGNVLLQSKIVNGSHTTADESETNGAYDHARFLIDESRLLPQPDALTISQ